LEKLLLQPSLEKLNIWWDLVERKGRHVGLEEEGRKANPDRLLYTLSKIRPKVLLLCGEEAWNLFKVGPLKKLINDVGIINFSPGRDVWVLHAPCLAEAAEMHRLLPQVEASFDRAVSVCNPHVPKVKKWVRPIEELLEKTAKILTAYDLETTSLDPRKGRILTASFTWREEKKLLTYWVENPKQSDLKRWWVKGPRIVHNAKFELSWTKPIKITDYHDTFLRAGLVDENESHRLEDQLLRYCRGYPYWSSLPDYGDFSDVPLHVVGTYNGFDTAYTYLLYEYQEGVLDDREKSLLGDVINPLSFVLWKMEEAGVKINGGKLKKLCQEMDEEIKTGNDFLRKKFGDINWSSPKQVRKLLYEEMKLPVLEMTKGGEPSTSKETIERLSKRRKSLLPIIRIREITSIRNGILSALEEKTDGNGYIHTTFNQGFVATGRLSSSNPNLQNIRREGAEKSCFTSRFPGGRLVAADYEQFELRICAAHSKDRMFRKLILEGQDPHTHTTKELELSSRQDGKQLNLSLASGISARGLAYEHGFSESKARKWRGEWFRLHPQIAMFHTKLGQDVRRKGYVTNLFGRKRHLPISKERNQNSQRRASNQAKNFPIQGGGADIINAAVVRLYRLLRKEGLKALIVLQIHDEIVVDSPKEEVKKVAELMKEAMTNPMPGFEFFVPMAIDLRVGTSIAK